MPSKEIANRTFDARPDRVDYRDRLYNPLLRSLPDQFPEQGMVAQYLKDYTQTHKLILDQGKEGACTGFGLAAVVNYLLYLKHLEQEAKTGKNHPKCTRSARGCSTRWPASTTNGREKITKVRVAAAP